MLNISHHGRRQRLRSGHVGFMNLLVATDGQKRGGQQNEIFHYFSVCESGVFVPGSGRAIPSNRFNSPPPRLAPWASWAALNNSAVWRFSCSWKNTIAISSVVCSPQCTCLGGVLGFRRLFEELSYRKRMCTFVPRGMSNGFLYRYSSCQSQSHPLIQIIGSVLPSGSVAVTSISLQSKCACGKTPMSLTAVGTVKLELVS